MNKTLLTTICSLIAMATISFAGETYVTSKDSTTNYSYYNAGETQVDVFGNYTMTMNHYREDLYLKQDHAFGASLDVKHFFTRNLGVGIDGAYIHSHDAAGQVTGNVIGRLPIKNSKFAPYGFVGVGPTFGKNRDAKITARTGLGIEYRFTPQISFKTDYSYNAVDGTKNNFGMARTGIGIAF